MSDVSYSGRVYCIVSSHPEVVEKLHATQHNTRQYNTVVCPVAAVCVLYSIAVIGSRSCCSCYNVLVTVDAATGMQRFLEPTILWLHQRCKHILYQDKHCPHRVLLSHSGSSAHPCCWRVELVDGDGIQHKCCCCCCECSVYLFRDLQRMPWWQWAW